jgi:hypothetical protein
MQSVVVRVAVHHPFVMLGSGVYCLLLVMLRLRPDLGCNNMACWRAGAGGLLIEEQMSACLLASQA